MATNRRPNCGHLLSAVYGITCIYGLLFVLLVHVTLPVGSRGETLLTSGNETLDADQLELQAWNHSVCVPDYNLFDQCMARPEYDGEIFHNTIAFQLHEDQMNSGAGMLICYQGYLDFYNFFNGINPDTPYRLNNVKDNEVGKMCEAARRYRGKQCASLRGEEEIDRCEEFVKYPWHGLQLRDDPANKNNTILSLSTTDKTFTFSRKNFHPINGRLFFKLARFGDDANSSVRSYFARTIGKSPFVENQTLCFGEDCHLYDFSIKNVGNDAYMKDYMGPWALGLDVLPKGKGATELQFFVIRSKCSEISASFLMPYEIVSSELPKHIPKKKINNGTMYTSDKSKAINENSTFLLRGKITENANVFQIVLVPKLTSVELHCPDDNVEEILTLLRLEFNFLTNNVTLFKNYKGKSELPAASQPNMLQRNQQFMLKAVAHVDGFNVSVNCGGNQTFALGQPLPFNVPLILKISGADIYYIGMTGNEVENTQKSLADIWMPIENGIVGNGRGIIIRSKVNANWQKIKFALLNADERPILTFNASKKKDLVDLKWASTNENCDKKIVQTDAIDKKCDCMEVFFEFTSQSIKIMLNGDPMNLEPEWQGGVLQLNQTAEVMKVHFDADIEEKMELKEATWTIPKEGKLFDLKDKPDKGDAIILTGKFFNNATNLEIKLINYIINDGDGDKDMEKVTKCFLTDSDEEYCTVVLHIRIQLNYKKAAINNQLRGGDENIWLKEKSFNTTKFVPGEQFSMKINAVKCINDRGSIVGKFTIDQIEEMPPYLRGDVNMIWVNLDDGALFDQPKIVENVADKEVKKCPP